MQRIIKNNDVKVEYENPLSSLLLDKASSYPPKPPTSNLFNSVHNPNIIKNPGKNDILFGRGNATNTHIGNIRFREAVKDHQGRYQSASKSDKPLVALHFVLMWKALDPPGRFLAKPCMGKSQNEDYDSDCWCEVDLKTAARKVAQRLREKPPQMSSRLRRQKREKTEVENESDKVIVKQLKVALDAESRIPNDAEKRNDFDDFSEISDDFNASFVNGITGDSHKDMTDVFPTDHFQDYDVENASDRDALPTAQALIDELGSAFL